jgi:hypothetical protein
VFKEKEMGILIFALVLLTIGIIIGIKEDDFYNLYFALSIMLLLIIGLVFFAVVVNGQNNIISYNYDKIQYNTAVNNKQITGQERAEIINLVTNDNTIIMAYKHWTKNFWIGLFYYKPIADLELFDISKIPYAKTNIKITE